MTQSPGHGKCAVHPWPGLCGMPLALASNDGLGITGPRRSRCLRVLRTRKSRVFEPCVLAGRLFWRDIHDADDRSDDCCCSRQYCRGDCNFVCATSTSKSRARDRKCLLFPCIPFGGGGLCANLLFEAQPFSCLRFDIIFEVNELHSDLRFSKLVEDGPVSHREFLSPGYWCPSVGELGSTRPELWRRCLGDA